jgi:hypothetical protein
MTSKLEELIAKAMELSAQERRLLVELLAESSAVPDARAPPYGTDRNDLSAKLIAMTSVTVVLPDELAKRAKDAGLLAGKSIEELIRRALQEQGVDTPLDPGVPRQQRRLIEQNGYLVVEALPGEKPITDAEVRDVLNDMEW